MKKFLTGLTMSLAFFASSQNNNGILDQIEEFCTPVEVPFTMPDGVKLMTNVYLPIVRDSLRVNIDIPLAGNVNVQIIKKGTQIVKYDSLNGSFNNNPYQLPFIFTRTPYGKEGNDMAGGVMSLLGYTYGIQDMRGRYRSEGIYYPMLSDSWEKTAYHPDYAHVLDVTSLNDPLNSNKHEDGYNSIEFILDSLTRDYGDLPHTDSMLHNGIIGMFGASALGNTQYQAAAAHRIDPSKAGLKGLIPIVATNEHHNVTGFQNGVFREGIVKGWLKGQLLDLIENSDTLDTLYQNAIHTPSDFDLNTKMEVADKAIEYFTTISSNGNLPNYYPNSPARSDMDASRAPVNAQGEADPDGNHSRYENMQVAAYHVTGWWDIFVDGQIETHKQMVAHIEDSLAKLQKLVIGPWAHQTVSSLSTGDMNYKDNALNITRFNLEQIEDADFGSILKSELIQWYRYTLNYNDYKSVGDASYIFPENTDWDDLGGYFSVRIPAEDYNMSFADMFNFLSGSQPLHGLKGEVRFSPPAPIPGDSISFTFSIPSFGVPLIEGLNPGAIEEASLPDFANEIPNIRFYVVGPVNDGVAENAELSNYWFASDTFPIVDNLHWEKWYLHQNGGFDRQAPQSDEGYAVYVHDPDDPVRTLGGANMIPNVPGSNKKSQGQINLADENYRYHGMDRPGVLQFESSVIVDSLCLIGFPRMKLYAKSSPSPDIDGTTDTDFFVRILDVYPDGREFFVVEGALNARAREYAHSLAVDNEDDNAVFSNINSGELYEYYFKLMPIAYTWGKGHKIKILISSSNHPRYQVNANLPVDDGTYYLREPMDGQYLNYNGQMFAARKAVQRIAFSPTHPTHLELPIYQEGFTKLEEASIISNDKLLVFPNPTSDMISIYLEKPDIYQLRMYEMSGKVLLEKNIQREYQIAFEGLEQGVYFLELISKEDGSVLRDKILKQ